MKPNNFAMKDWHLEHVEKVIIRYIKGISPDASSFEKRNFKKYDTISELREADRIRHKTRCDNRRRADGHAKNQIRQIFFWVARES